MPLEVLIVPDKFKGTLTAKAAADAMARGWRRGRPKDAIEVLPMSDGGDGFGEVISNSLGAVPRSLRTCDAAHRGCTARWWWEPKSKTAIIETARIIGLAMLPHERYHPFDLDTYGLGKVMRAAADLGARRCLVGLGGSATNDGGFGLARALGWEFLDGQTRAIERWTKLLSVRQVRRPARERWFSELVVAVDVQNLLLGSQGATRVYGPQKGLKPSDFPLAEACLHKLASLLKRDTGSDFARQPGAGAAGGLGFGFLAFLGGHVESGFKLFAREAELERRLRVVDLVISGEGAIDRSTFMGKGAGRIAQRCRKLGIPCVGLAGMIDPDCARRQVFSEMHALTDLTTVTNARREPTKWLERLASQVAAGRKSGNRESVNSETRGR
jgi:glycerate kinase